MQWWREFEHAEQDWYSGSRSERAAAPTIAHASDIAGCIVGAITKKIRAGGGYGLYLRSVHRHRAMLWGTWLHEGIERWIMRHAKSDGWMREVPCRYDEGNLVGTADLVLDRVRGEDHGRIVVDIKAGFTPPSSVVSHHRQVHSYAWMLFGDNMYNEDEMLMLVFQPKIVVRDGRRSPTFFYPAQRVRPVPEFDVKERCRLYKEALEVLLEGDAPDDPDWECYDPWSRYPWCQDEEGVFDKAPYWLCRRSTCRCVECPHLRK